MSSLTQLIKLDLSNNELKFLPESFGSLINLKHLDLFNNKIESLPLSFGNLRKLQYLDLRKNSLTPALQNVVGPCLTTKDCALSAKQTILFMNKMLVEFQENKLREQAVEDLRKKQDIKRLKDVAKALDRIAKRENAEKEKQLKQEKLHQKSMESEEEPANNQKETCMTKSLGKIDASLQQPFKWLMISLVFINLCLVLMTIWMPNLKIFNNELPFRLIFQNIYKNGELMVKNIFDKVLN